MNFECVIANGNVSASNLHDWVAPDVNIREYVFRSVLNRDLSNNRRVSFTSEFVLMEELL